MEPKPTETTADTHIANLARTYFATVKRYEAESAVDATGQLVIGTRQKMDDDWNALREAVEAAARHDMPRRRRLMAKTELRQIAIKAGASRATFPVQKGKQYMRIEWVGFRADAGQRIENALEERLAEEFWEMDEYEIIYSTSCGSGPGGGTRTMRILSGLLE